MKLVLLVSLLPLCLFSQEEAGFLEEHFPFFTTMLKTSTGQTSPRGLVIKAGNDFYACFDTDKLTYSVIWQGKGITLNAMASGSYNSKSWFKKSPEGEKNPPRIIGKELAYSNTSSAGVWNGLYLTDKGSVISYTLSDGVKVFEHLYSPDKKMLVRQIRIYNSKQAFLLPVADLKASVSLLSNKQAKLIKGNKHLSLSVEAAEQQTVSLIYSFDKTVETKPQPFPSIDAQATKYWPATLETKTTTAVENGNYLFEEIGLPSNNSFGRKVRLSGISFFDDNKAVLCTFEGDIWILELKNNRWKRFASGFNEPQSLVIKNQQLYVFDRNGITRLHDRDKNGEADFYENFCNLPIQTMESRDFAMDMVLHPDGSFILSKGGQRGQSLSPHAGSILKISPDGKQIEVLATNLREPYLGIDPDKGDIFVTDQQGNWIPTTPIHLVKKGANFGFKAGFQGKEPFKNITEPLIWIPYTMNQSAGGIFKFSKNQFYVLDYSRPGIGILHYDNEDPQQSAYRNINLNIPFPLLKGALNPANGQAYFTGFKIWGSKGSKISGLGRLIQKDHLALETAKYFKEGIYLSFSKEIPQTFLNHSKISMKRWNIKRTYQYGSGHFNLDKSAGEEGVLLSSVTLSKNKKAVFIAVPDMQKVDQMSIEVSTLKLAFTIKALKSYTPVKELFPVIDFSLPAIKIQTQNSVASAEKGFAIAKKFGCITCHAITENEVGKPGPSWIKLAGSTKILSDKSSTVANADYIKESVLAPANKVVKGFQPLMPSYKGMISESDLDSLVLYIQSLK
ncbi:MAG: c-type cytochrome [Lentisphaeraceae bacterium]|nr:c-type cytochrome [Lentisphaeraceae bacterium]